MTVTPRTAGVVGTSSTLLGLSWIFVWLRFYVRHFLVHKLDWDDFFLLITLFLYTVFSATILTVASVHEFSYPIPPTSEGLYAALPGLSKGLHYFYMTEVFYILTAMFLRTSVALLLLRVAISKSQRVTIYSVITLMILTSLSFLFVVVFQCSPVNYYWDENPQARGTCVHHVILANVGYAHMAVSFVADWTLGLLPIWLLWNVQISRRRKGGIGVLLGFGLLCGIAAIVRTPYIKQLLDTTDFERSWVPLALCSIIEPGLGILAASTAAFRPLFQGKKWQNLNSKISNRRLVSRSKNGGSKPGTGRALEEGHGEGDGIIQMVTTTKIKDGEERVGFEDVALRGGL